MDYEKKYKEIVGQIKKAYLYAQTDSTKAVLEEIFPELEDSKDEKVRKALKQYFVNSFRNNGVAAICGVHVKDVLAWLEKQGKKRKITHEEICKSYGIPDIGEFSDGYHTFNGLYKQRMILFAVLVKTYKDRAWKSWKHEDGLDCFGGGWFIVGIDTPAGTYTYHYEAKDWDRFDCQILEKAKHWDGHDESDVERLFSLVSNTNKDEVIKCLINGMKFYYEDNEEATWGTEKFSMKVKDILSWLEKQGEQKDYTFKSIPRLLEIIEPSNRAKAYCQKLINTLVNEGYNNDAKIVEEVLNGWNGENIPMAVMDEQNPTDKVEPKFKVGDKIYLKPEYRMPDDDTPIANTVKEIRRIDDKHYRFDGSYIFIEDQDKYELVEQKPKENKGNIGGISPNWSEEEERYICQLESMVKERWTLAEKEQDEEVIKNMSNLAFFLKTLNPNKKPTDEEMKTLLRTEYEKGRADAIAEMQGKWSEEDEENFCSVYLDVKSARQNTVNSLSGDLKEQEEKRMDEVISWLESLKGRVQPKQEWTEEEIEPIISDYLCGREHYGGMMGRLCHLKPKQKQTEWGEDDKAFLDDILCKLEHDLILNKDEKDWLKSLRPQNRWKPSETDIMILEKVFNGKIDPKDFQETLSNVLEQLKKLNEKV